MSDKSRLVLTLREGEGFKIYPPSEVIELRVLEASGKEDASWVRIQTKLISIPEATLTPEGAPIVLGELEVTCLRVHATRTTVAVVAPRAWRVEKTEMAA